MQMQRIDIAVQASGCNSKKSQSRGSGCQTERQEEKRDTLMSSQARLSMKRNPWLLTRELQTPRFYQYPSALSWEPAGLPKKKMGV